uniref:GST N-terminal domain-containing protein n=1 Tax=Tetradesmus obliquus TaxID=3088 RepID=A0A383VTK7_TETOB
MATATAEEVYELPAAAVRTLTQPGLRLELHCISISHYCMRAKWALQLAGLPFAAVHYLPLAHVAGIKRLQRRFNQGPGAATASSKSPSATPVLAIYSPQGEPLSLVANSTLISRYAALRAAAAPTALLVTRAIPAAALHYLLPCCSLVANSTLISRYAALRAAAVDLPGIGQQLYGPNLTLALPAAGAAVDQAAGSSSSSKVVGAGPQYEAVSQLELRLSGTLGIEVRRVMYHYLLPRWHLAGHLFSANASSTIGWLLSPLTYLLSRLLLPKVMAINAATAARGMQRLQEEFDFFDSVLLTQQQQQQQGKKAAVAAAADGSSSGKLPYYLCGPQLTAADVSVAGLGGYVVGVPAGQMGLAWSPGIEDMPKELGHFMQSLRERPTGQFILEMWRVHGPLLQQGTKRA